MSVFFLSSLIFWNKGYRSLPRDGVESCKVYRPLPSDRNMAYRSKPFSRERDKKRKKVGIHSRCPQRKSSLRGRRKDDDESAVVVVFHVAVVIRAVVGILRDEWTSVVQRYESTCRAYRKCTVDDDIIQKIARKTTKSISAR